MARTPVPAMLPAKAAYSPASGGIPDTPIPPATRPFLKIGTPPPSTVVGLLSKRSALPVLIPVPQPAVFPFAHGPPARLVARGTFGIAKPKSQPRFVFSIP